jgi:hypothetical protein
MRVSARKALQIAAAMIIGALLAIIPLNYLAALAAGLFVIGAVLFVLELRR